MSAFFPQDRFIQITISLGNRHYNMLNLAKATLNTHLKPTHNKLCSSHTPTFNETHRTLRILAPKMLKPHKDFIRTISTVYSDPFVTLNVLTDKKTPAFATPIRASLSTTNRHIVLMPSIIDRQKPILVLQDLPVQTHTLRQRLVVSLNIQPNHSHTNAETPF
jgi:hypothetical protein